MEGLLSTGPTPSSLNTCKTFFILNLWPFRPLGLELFLLEANWNFSYLLKEGWPWLTAHKCAPHWNVLPITRGRVGHWTASTGVLVYWWWEQYRESDGVIQEYNLSGAILPCCACCCETGTYFFLSGATGTAGFWTGKNNAVWSATATNFSNRLEYNLVRTFILQICSFQ